MYTGRREIGSLLSLKSRKTPEATGGDVMLSSLGPSQSRF